MILCERIRQTIFVHGVRLTNLKRMEQSIYLWKHKAKEDKVSTTLIGEIMPATYKGKWRLLHKFLRTSRRKALLKAMVDVNPRLTLF